MVTTELGNKGGFEATGIVLGHIGYCNGNRGRLRSARVL